MYPDEPASQQTLFVTMANIPHITWIVWASLIVFALLLRSVMLPIDEYRHSDVA